MLAASTSLTTLSVISANLYSGKSLSLTQRTSLTSSPARNSPPTTLQTTPAQQEGEVEARIRNVLAHASTDLNRVNYQQLGRDARTQYDTAKGFIRQAEDAIRARNLLFAGSLADKAAALAAQLAGR